jgi:hypothetical protein
MTDRYRFAEHLDSLTEMLRERSETIGAAVMVDNSTIPNNLHSNRDLHHIDRLFRTGCHKLADFSEFAQFVISETVLGNLIESHKMALIV